MQTRRFARFSGMVLAVMLTLVVGQGLVFGHDDDKRGPSKSATSGKAGGLKKVEPLKAVRV
jgi:hypothetical protein